MQYHKGHAYYRLNAYDIFGAAQGIARANRLLSASSRDIRHAVGRAVCRLVFIFVVAPYDQRNQCNDRYNNFL